MKLYFQRNSLLRRTTLDVLISTKKWFRIIRVWPLSMVRVTPIYRKLNKEAD